ncbi:MAG: hypothetical protein J5838_03985 [Desulfovibrio sp.]|nr:hypothetical protein [Desulfovibrio sp.]
MKLLFCCLAAAAVILGFAPMNPFARTKTVGTDVGIGDVTEFYYTYSTSTNPPEYQRYRFYLKEGKPAFHHERREGDRWPLTEKDVTVSGGRHLSGQEWAEFFDTLKGGTVRNREEHTESGDSGPWLFLYWKGDRSKCREFSFANYGSRLAFEALCSRLKGE